MGAKGQQSILSDPGAAVVAATAQNQYGMDGSDMSNAQVAMNPYTYEASPPGIDIGPDPRAYPPSAYGAPMPATGPSSAVTPGAVQQPWYASFLPMKELGPGDAELPWRGTPTTQGGASAWAQYRAGEQGGPGMQPDYAKDPMGELIKQPTSGYASGSPESTQGGPVQLTEQGQAGQGVDWRKILKGANEGMKNAPQMAPNNIPSVPGLAAAQYATPEAKLGPFLVMPFQSRILRSMGMNDEQGRGFLANQIMAGNPQYGPYSAQQIAAAQQMFGQGRAKG